MMTIVSEVDRREALKKSAAAGAVAWVAPTLVSSRALAQDGVCTPKCAPLGTPTYTTSGPTGSCGGSYIVTIVINPVQGSVTCPCGFDPTLGNATLTRSFARNFRGEADLTQEVTLTCSDNATDPCEITCTVTATINITGNPGNSCSQNDVTLVGALDTDCQTV